MTAIIIYTTDPWHSIQSREIIAVASTEKNRDRIVRQFLSKGVYHKPSKEAIDIAIEELRQMGQTQSLSESTDLEIDTEAYEVNSLQG